MRYGFHQREIVLGSEKLQPHERAVTDAAARDIQDPLGRKIVFSAVNCLQVS